MRSIKVVVSIDNEEQWQINALMKAKFIDDLINEVGDKNINGEQIREFFKELL